MSGGPYDSVSDATELARGEAAERELPEPERIEPGTQPHEPHELQEPHAPTNLAPPQTPETIREIRVHGNAAVLDADVISLAGLSLGQTVTAETLSAAEERLKQSGATILDAPAEYPQYGAGYYAVFFADPDGLKLEYCHYLGK